MSRVKPGDAATETPALATTVAPRATGILKRVGGSQSDDWNDRIIDDTLQALWVGGSDHQKRDRQVNAAIAGLIAIGPKEELEGMMAAQLIAAHSASMECYRRAMLGEQTFEGRSENLNQANKLSRTFTMLLDALNRHRGKGQQKVTVEHIHVHSGAQAVVGVVETRGVGIARNRRNNPLQSSLPMHLSRRCGAQTRCGCPCQSPAMPNGRCRLHGGLSPGAPKGNRNARKHGQYAVDAMVRRREISTLIQAMKSLSKSAGRWGAASDG
jgi:hypothetical protein